MTARSAVVAALLLTLVAGCGVPAEDEARPLPASGTVPGTGPVVEVSPSPAGSVAQPFYFVRRGRLVPVVRWIGPATPLDALTRTLLAGPTSSEAAADLTSALTGTATVRGVRRSGAIALVDLGDDPPATGRTDEILAFGQIVCTLTARTDVSGVAFVRGDQPLEVPRPDGSLSAQPMAALTYADLLAPA
ncbi:GerMN domain-containing protein [Virgisporangium ochraceum]|uniref:GerMN domain-containing protein n=1 Tax=Virgisporangium ochraceum TaxID=65505 RepID=A0A8J4EHR8_9ACTN|nr:GerMN domain-containing protein [Virgisporangium ochraceum]GIJ72477.1 hypothetical protein Voc01_073940 [Virgisporangium ochraceum]